MGKDFFKGKTVVIGVTGGIAAYKVIDIIKNLRMKGAVVHVIMTEHALRLVHKEDFEKASGNEVMTSLFQPGIDYGAYIKKDKKIDHISLADIADLFLVCPATANVLGKVANGICDDLLTTSVCATAAPVMFCPAMNVKMWHNPLVQKNLAVLREAGYHLVEPEYGDLACGYKGMGRLAKGERVIELSGLLLKKTADLEGKKVVVTAGATSEEIDPVRVITNKSSGKMGVDLAEQAYLRGAEVVLIKGAHAVQARYPLKEEKVVSVEDLKQAIQKHLKGADIVIHAAAVSDFTTGKNNGKIKSTDPLMLELQPTTKILENIKKWKKDVFLVGFKAEHKLSVKELVSRAASLLKDAEADLMVANDIGKKERGFDVDTNEVWLVDRKGGKTHLGLADKRVIADRILDKIVEMVP